MRHLLVALLSAPRWRVLMLSRVLDARILHPQLHPIVRPIQNGNPRSILFVVPHSTERRAIRPERTDGLVRAYLVISHGAAELQRVNVSVSLPSFGSIEFEREVHFCDTLVDGKVGIAFHLSSWYNGAAGVSFRFVVRWRAAHDVGDLVDILASINTPFWGIVVLVGILYAGVFATQLDPIIGFVGDGDPRSLDPFFVPSQGFGVRTQGADGIRRTNVGVLLSAECIGIEVGFSDPAFLSAEFPGLILGHRVLIEA
mmetsp:Transcript_23087/g.49823  ORF Transcript_23087/g.49823 Transcript_23087/m.49823 type:complete len:256 (-) Transcript_23087:809-1576(-)